jgi:hypothetical protein
MHTIPVELLAKIAEHIHVTESGCHEWPFRTKNKAGAPVVYIPGRSATISVRLVLWRAAHPDETRCSVSLPPTCGNPRCVRLADGHVVNPVVARSAAKVQRRLDCEAERQAAHEAATAAKAQRRVEREAERRETRRRIDAATAQHEQERAERLRQRQERRDERERQRGRVVSEWSAYSAHPTRPDPDVVLPEPEHPFFKPQPAVHKCATGIHRLPTIDTECDMCRVITVGRDAAFRRRHITL